MASAAEEMARAVAKFMGRTDRPFTYRTAGPAPVIPGPSDPRRDLRVSIDSHPPCTFMAPGGEQRAHVPRPAGPGERPPTGLPAAMRRRSGERGVLRGGRSGELAVHAHHDAEDHRALEVGLA